MVLSPALVDRVDAVFADMDKSGHPGAVLLVIDHDEIVYREGYGLADLETQRPITADTSFYLASIAKQFTAMAIMLLAEQGKLSFDDHLLTYFPQFPSWGAEITLRHMLHHTSGLPDYFALFKPPEADELNNARDMRASLTRTCSSGRWRWLDRSFPLAGNTRTAARAMCCWR